MEPCFPWRLDRVQGEKEGRPRDLHPGIDSVVTSWKRPSGVCFLPVPYEWNQFLGPEDRNHDSVLSGPQAGNRMRQRCAEQSRGWGDAPEGMGWGPPDLKLSPLWGSLTMSCTERGGPLGTGGILRDAEPCLCVSHKGFWPWTWVSVA